jgi:hypothetical protein
MKANRMLAGLAVVGALTAGCAAPDAAAPPSPAASKSPAATEDHDDMDMDMDMSAAEEPSEPAAMICSDEIKDAVRRTFVLDAEPTGAPQWSARDRLFSCTYRLPEGRLRLSVQDATQQRVGRAYFDRLRGTLPGARTVTGMDNFGFPAFQAASGQVVFLKDGKTLQVDASSLPEAALPAGYSRAEAAYSVASAVVACWTE